jgi:hypothetical protein
MKLTGVKKTEQKQIKENEKGWKKAINGKGQ